SRRRHTRSKRDWSSDVSSSDLFALLPFHTALTPFSAKKLSKARTRTFASSVPRSCFSMTLTAMTGSLNVEKNQQRDDTERRANIDRKSVVYGKRGRRRGRRRGE